MERIVEGRGGRNLEARWGNAMDREESRNAERIVGALEVFCNHVVFRGRGTAWSQDRGAECSDLLLIYVKHVRKISYFKLLVVSKYY
jgi:hypothetical protein